MIQTLLQREPNGSWTIPDSSIPTELISCADKCNNALAFLGDIRGVTNLKNRIQHLHQAAHEEVNRNELVARIVQVAVSAQELKSIHANSPLIEEQIDRLRDELTQTIGEVPAALRGQLLHSATKGGQKEVVEFLLNEGTHVDVSDENGLQPLHVAAENGQREIVELLLSRGANVDAATDSGIQPLHAAALNGHKEVVELLLSKNAFIHARSFEGCQPMHWATSGGEREIVKLLLSKGADVNAADNFGQQPLHVAAMKGDKKMVEMLLSKGAYVFALDRDGKQPLNCAEYYDHKDVKNLLLKAQNLEPLRKVYRERGHLERFLDKTPFPIDKSYINLAIVDQVNYEDTERKTRTLDRFSAEVALFDQPKCIELSQLFDGNSHVYIEGNAGSGKSTLCHYLAYNWATLTSEERLRALGPWANRYEAVVWIPLREIRILSKEAKFSDLVEKLYQGLVLGSGETLYILDGFDEVVSLEEVCENFVEDKRWEIVNYLINQPHWLMTSRPGLFSKRFLASRRLKNLGFTESNIRSYIRRFSEDFKIPGEDLERAVFASNDLKILAHVPLYLELVCSLWMDSHTILNTLSNPVALYDAMAVYLFRRHIERLQKKPISLPKDVVLDHKDVQPFRVCLEKVAFLSRQLGSNRITPAVYGPIFAFDPLNAYSDQEREDFGKRLFEDLGLLARRGNSRGLFDQDYAFLHPTFEEYFAARHVVSELGSSNKLVSEETADEWLKANSLLKEKERVIDFIASLAKTDVQLNALADSLMEDQKANVNNNSWQSPLHRSASFGFISLTNLLIKKGAKVDAAKKDGRQPVHLAALSGHKEIVELLLQNGAIVNAADNVGWQPVHLAALGGHKQVVELLLQNGAKVCASDKEGWMPVHAAALNGHKEVVELLLKNGAKVEATNNNSVQPIHAAALNGHKEVVELLLQNGAKVDVAYNYGSQPVHIAAQQGYKEVVELLLEHGAKADAKKDNGWQPVHLAAWNGRTEVMELLLRRGAKVDAATSNGWESVHLAARNGRKEVIELLLKYGAKVDAARNDGWQPVHSAAENGRTEVMELLLRQGAKVEAATNVGWQSVHSAALHGHKEVVELLLEKGAKVDAATINGWQPLHSAAQHGHKEVVELLLQKGAKVNVAPKDEWQALHLAARDGHKEVVELLLQKGANVSAATSNGWEAVHIAARNGHKEVVELLLKHGAKADATKDDGWQPVHFAAQNGHKEVVQLLKEYLKRAESNRAGSS